MFLEDGIWNSPHHLKADCAVGAPKKFSRPRTKTGRLRRLDYREGLNARNGQNLAPTVVSTGSAHAVRARRSAAVGTAAECAGVPAIRSLAGTQAHFGHFSFWNSHKTRSWRLRLKLDAVQRIPNWFRLLGLNGFLRMQVHAGAVFQTVPIAVRVGGKGEDNVFSERLCQVYLFRSSQFYLAGKVWDLYGIIKTFEAFDASQAKRAFNAPRRKKATIAESDVQRVRQRRCGHRGRILEIENFDRILAF